MIYFVPEATEAYARLGITGRAGYFASRAAPMGAVSAEVVVSTFFNFNPDLVRSAIPGAWERASPGEVLEARLSAVDSASRRILGDAVVGSPEMEHAAALARAAALVASEQVEGRPLAAGYAEMAWPEEAHLMLWHAQSILREFRGDGHIAQLVVHGLSGLEALVTHAAAGEVPAHVLRATRAWSEGAWDASVHELRTRGWLEGGEELAFTAWGAAQRNAIEAETDSLAAAPYEALGEAAATELRALVRPWSTAFADVVR